MISEQTKAAIQREAEEMFPFEASSHFVSNANIQLQREAYIAGATAWAEKLENISAFGVFIPNAPQR